MMGNVQHLPRDGQQLHATDSLTCCLIFSVISSLLSFCILFFILIASFSYPPLSFFIFFYPYYIFILFFSIFYHYQIGVKGVGQESKEETIDT